MNRRILLIDDDRLQYRLTQAHFKNFRGEAFELDWAGTIEEGLAKLLARVKERLSRRAGPAGG